jgi:uncharacterized OB-fold protein
MSMEIVSVAHERRYPPRVTKFTEPFWRGLSEGRFLTTRCQSCSRLSFPPKPICPHCWQNQVSWELLPPGGRLYSWTRIHAGPAIFEQDLPYEVGIVDLECGIRLACPLQGTAVDWQCDMAVRLITLSYTDGPLLAATPA